MNQAGPVPKPKYKCRCEHCGQDTAVGYEEWLALTELMLTFSRLSSAQKEMVMLIMDGLRYRSLADKAGDNNG